MPHLPTASGAVSATSGAFSSIFTSSTSMRLLRVLCDGVNDWSCLPPTVICACVCVGVCVCVWCVWGGCTPAVRMRSGSKPTTKRAQTKHPYAVGHENSCPTAAASPPDIARRSFASTWLLSSLWLSPRCAPPQEYAVVERNVFRWLLWRRELSRTETDRKRKASCRRPGDRLGTE